MAVSLQGRRETLGLGSFQDSWERCVCGGEGTAAIAVTFRVLLSPEKCGIESLSVLTSLFPASLALSVNGK